jgi:hypothetical protein
MKRGEKTIRLNYLISGYFNSGVGTYHLFLALIHFGYILFTQSNYIQSMNASCLV